VPSQDRVEVCDPLIARGFREQSSPVGGETVEVRVTVPTNPLTLLTEIVEVAKLLANTVCVCGLALSVKSGAGVTTSVMVAECVVDPLVAVMLTR
jgi:hypothetical protein